ncbi:hypothetical protein N431DRAFT_485921 [Stipitochalara longipes BDJ]|nr:hypothetical protein N431DRAFT_485921 [Stipitochalara longipes BDJ]
MDITTPTTFGASPAPSSTNTTDKKLSFQLLGKLWQEKKRKDTANTPSTTSYITTTAPAPAPAPVVSGAKKVWAEQRAAATAANRPTNPSTPPESRPIATPTTRQPSDPTSPISDEGNSMDWDESDEEMMDFRDDYPGWGNIGSCQAAWVYEMIILPSMIVAGMPLIPSPSYAYSFVR